MSILTPFSSSSKMWSTNLRISSDYTRKSLIIIVLGRPSSCPERRIRRHPPRVRVDRLMALSRTRNSFPINYMHSSQNAHGAVSPFSFCCLVCSPCKDESHGERCQCHNRHIKWLTMESSAVWNSSLEISQSPPVGEWLLTHQLCSTPWKRRHDQALQRLVHPMDVVVVTSFWLYL